MGIEKITEYCRVHNFGNPDAIIQTSPEDLGKRFDLIHYDQQHRDNMQAVQRSDPALEVAITSISAESFNKLLFLDLDETKNLVQNHRSIQELSIFMRDSGLTMAELLKRPDLIGPGWIRRVHDVHYKDFDYGRFGPLSLQPPNDRELADTRYGCWTLADGNHRTLAMMLKAIVENAIPFEEIEVILAWFDRDRLQALSPSVKL
jgi:hypothetical protein